MKAYMNPPDPQPWTDDDVLMEYARVGNRRKVSKIYNIPLRGVNRILRSGVCQETECPYNQGDPCLAKGGCAGDVQELNPRDVAADSKLLRPESVSQPDAVQ